MDAVVFTASIFLLNILYMLNINYKLLVFKYCLIGNFFNNFLKTKRKKFKKVVIQYLMDGTPILKV